MATNNGRKINYNTANSLARRLSAKAFEHLLGPVEKEISKVAEEAVRAGFIGKNLPKLLSHDLFYAHDAASSIDVLPQSYELPDGSALTVEGCFGFGSRSYSNVVIRDDDAYEKLLPLVTRQRELRKQSYALLETIRLQVKGKSVGAVRKAWPEAGDLINEVFGTSNGPELTQPLEQLLARFLPMLPAPQPETEGV